MRELMDGRSCTDQSSSWFDRKTNYTYSNNSCLFVTNRNYDLDRSNFGFKDFRLCLHLKQPVATTPKNSGWFRNNLGEADYSGGGLHRTFWCGIFEFSLSAVINGTSSSDWFLTIGLSDYQTPRRNVQQEVPQSSSFV